MFAYCRNNPVRRRDIPGTTDVDIFDDGDANLLDDDKEISGGKMGNGSSGGSGSSTVRSTQTQTGSSNASASGSGSSSVPQYANDVLEHVKSHNGSPPKGYKGGKLFENDGRNGSAQLPDRYAPYREYDVHPKIAGQGRGSERIVVGIGAAFYTPDHYMTFIRME